MVREYFKFDVVLMFGHTPTSGSKGVTDRFFFSVKLKKAGKGLEGGPSQLAVSRNYSSSLHDFMRF